MATDTQTDGKILKLGSKSFRISKKEEDAIHQAVAKAWKPTISKLRATMQNVHAMWTIHEDLLKGSFVTASIISKVWGVTLPPVALLKAADAAIDKLAADVASPQRLLSAKADLEAAIKATTAAATKMQEYHEGMCMGSDSCIAGLRNIRDGAVAVGEVTVAAMTLGASVEVQIGAAGAYGSYKEAVAQIEKAGGPDHSGPLLAVTAVLSAGARDALIGHFLKDGAFGKLIVEHISKKAASYTLKLCTKELTAKLVERMTADGAKEAIKVGLTDVCNNLNGIKKMSLPDIAQHVADSAFKKMMFGALFTGLSKQLGTVSDDVFKKIVKGELKGVDKITDDKLKKEALKLVESAVEKSVQNVILNNVSKPDKTVNLDNLMMVDLSRDTTFMASMKKLKK